MADIMPGSADGNTILKIVRIFPAPSARLPSRKLSCTDFKLSSVERTIVGSSIMLIVSVPAKMELVPPINATNVIIPNKP